MRTTPSSSCSPWPSASCCRRRCEPCCRELYPIWLPELFPTRVRATGITVVFNLGRYIAALGPIYAGILIVQFHGIPKMAVILSIAYLVAPLLVPLLPETRGQPLPD